MEAHPIGISILGFVCLGLFTVLVMGIIVSTVVLLVTSKNPRVHTGMVVVVALELFLLLGLGFITSWSAARSQEQATIDYDHGSVQSGYVTSPEPRVTTTILSSHCDLSKLPLSVPPAAPINDLRHPPIGDDPAESLVATAPPAPAAESRHFNPAGGSRMEAVPVMTRGTLCIGMMLLMVLGIIVGAAVLLATNKNPHVRTGVRTTVILFPVMLLLVAGATLFGFRTVAVPQEAAIEYDHGSVQRAYESLPEPRVTTTILSSHGDLSKLPPPFPNNDLRPEAVPDVPADALAALTTSPPAPVVPPTPNPTGDLRPDWLKKGVTKEGYVTTTVDCTGLYATQEEAERRVNGIVERVMDLDLTLVMLRDVYIGFRASFVPRSAYSLYVKDRYVEAETRDLGTVTAPMYRIWLKMEQSPQTQDKLYELYRPHVAAFRLKLVAALLVGFLAIPVGILVSARGIRATQGRGKWLWKTAGTALVVAVWVTGMMLLKLNAIIAL